MQTPRYKIRRSNRFDPGLIKPQLGQEEEYELFMAHPWSAYESDGFGMTLVEHDVPIAMAGMFRMWPGVYEGWAIFGHRVSSRNIVPLFRSIKSVVDAELQTSAHRVQTKIKSNFEPGIRMAGMLGMKREGLLVNFSPSRVDYFMYARTR